MNSRSLGLRRRSSYSRHIRARNRRNAKVLAGLACLLLVWLAYGVDPRSAPSSRSAVLPDAPDVTSPAPAAKADSVKRAASSKPDALSVPAVADAALPAAYVSNQAEPVAKRVTADDSDTPLESTHVPFLESVVAAADHGVTQTGSRGRYQGVGGFGGWGGGGAFPVGYGAAPESQFADTGNERASQLGFHAVEDASFGDSTDSGSANGDENNQGSNNQGSNNQGSNSQGSNSQGSNNQGSNNQGSNNQGSNNQGSNNQGSNNQGSNNQGSNNQGSNGGSENGLTPQVSPLVDETHPTGEGGGVGLNVPEPGLMLLTGIGLAAIAGRRRNRRN